MIIMITKKKERIIHVTIKISKRLKKQNKKIKIIVILYIYLTKNMTKSVKI